MILMKKWLLFFCVIATMLSFLIACAPAQQPAEQAPIIVEKPTSAQPIDETPKIKEKIVEQVKAEEPEETASAPETLNVVIKSFKFVPADIIVNIGDTVVWTNEDSAPHTVESSDGTLRSDELSKSDSFSYTFTKSGKYNYICGIHPSMKGSVTVQ